MGIIDALTFLTIFNALHVLAGVTSNTNINSNVSKQVEERIHVIFMASGLIVLSFGLIYASSEGKMTLWKLMFSNWVALDLAVIVVYP